MAAYETKICNVQIFRGWQAMEILSPAHPSYSVGHCSQGSYEERRKPDLHTLIKRIQSSHDGIMNTTQWLLPKKSRISPWESTFWAKTFSLCGFWFILHCNIYIYIHWTICAVCTVYEMANLHWNMQYSLWFPTNHVQPAWKKM